MIGTKMSVVHLSTEKGWRGGEQQVKLLTDGLVARGHKCVVMSPPDAALFADRDKARMAVPLNVRFGEFDVLAARQIADVARKVKANVLHAHTSHAHALGLLASRMIKKPLCVSRRVDFPVGGNWFSKRKYLAHDVHYIAISDAVKQVLMESGIGEAQVSVAYSGVDPERFRPRGPQRDETLAAQYGGTPGVPLLVNVAALTDHKDHETMLHAARLMRDRGFAFHLVIAGTGELEQKLREQTRESRLEEHVTFAGFVKDVGGILRAGDLFVMSSHLEGLCTSILDAMSVGIPVVATAAGGIPEIVKDKKNGLLARPRDAAGLATAIQSALSDSAQLQRFAEEGRRTVMEKFTCDKMVEATVDAYCTAERLLSR